MIKVIHDTKNYLEKITELFCFISVDEKGEGIIAESMSLPGLGMTMMPFVCADKARLESLITRAKEITRETGKNIRLIKFCQRELIEEFA